jgi:adenosylmethionine-8-amino-7-oxononanoate aminotransferase
MTLTKDASLKSWPPICFVLLCKLGGPVNGGLKMQLKSVNLTAQQVIDLTQKYMIETYQRFPFIATRAKGMYLYDENDQPYLDFYGGIAVNNAGNCNDKVVAAVKDQVGDIMHTFNYPYTIPQAVLAELVCKTLGMDKIFYQNSGTEANEAMIKLARKYGTDNFGPEKYHIITAKQSFHGRTFGAIPRPDSPTTPARPDSSRCCLALLMLSSTIWTRSKKRSRKTRSRSCLSRYRAKAA